MRQAGLHKVDDLAAEAMLDLGLASTLLAKVPRAAVARGYGVLLAGKSAHRPGCLFCCVSGETTQQHRPRRGRRLPDTR
jgi:hypothetical protein